MTDASAQAPGKAAAHSALQQHLRRQVRGVVALILVLSAALAALSLVPDVRHESIERPPVPATSAASGDPVPSGPPPVPPASGKDEAGTPAATPPTGSLDASTGDDRRAGFHRRDALRLRRRPRPPRRPRLAVRCRASPPAGPRCDDGERAEPRGSPRAQPAPRPPRAPPPRPTTRRPDRATT